MLNKYWDGQIDGERYMDDWRKDKWMEGWSKGWIGEWSWLCMLANTSFMQERER